MITHSSAHFTSNIVNERALTNCQHPQNLNSKLIKISRGEFKRANLVICATTHLGNLVGTLKFIVTTCIG